MYEVMEYASVTVCDAHSACLSRFDVHHVCGRGEGKRAVGQFPPLNLNISFQFVFHKNSDLLKYYPIQHVQNDFLHIRWCCSKVDVS
jgi:hypothetical protein